MVVIGTGHNFRWYGSIVVEVGSIEEKSTRSLLVHKEYSHLSGAVVEAMYKGVALSRLLVGFCASSGLGFFAAQNAFSSSDELKLDENKPR